MLPPNFKSTLWANFWLPCVWIRASTTTGAPPTSWCPLWWVLLKKLNCRVRASRQKEIEKQPIKIEKIPWLHLGVLSWSFFSSSFMSFLLNQLGFESTTKIYQENKERLHKSINNSLLKYSLFRCPCRRCCTTLTILSPFPFRLLGI